MEIESETVLPETASITEPGSIYEPTSGVESEIVDELKSKNETKNIDVKEVVEIITRAMLAT
eukprot:686307-Ditylum_brightwellii.AAC.1